MSHSGCQGSPRQLIKGVELLENLPTDATNSDYATLQQNLDKVPHSQQLRMGT